MCPSYLVKPEHIDLLRRALPFFEQAWVVDEVVALLAEGLEHVVLDTMPTQPFLDGIAVRFCYWITHNHMFPSETASGFIDRYAHALEKELLNHEPRRT